MVIKKIIKRCARCGLPETYPGIQFNQDYICNYCVYYDLFKEREKLIKKDLGKGFAKLINKVKKENHKYHCIVAYSGGKDSTFLLSNLKNRFELKILACTFNNGFISSSAFQNIKNITKKLDIDSKIVSLDFELLKEAFTYALTEKIPYPKEIVAMVSPVCAVCIGMVFGITLDLAIKLKIPLLFTGFTPGQYPVISLENFLKVKSCLFFSDKIYRDDPDDVLKILADPIREKFGEKIGQYFFRSQYVPEGTNMPKILFPFHTLLDYDEKEIMKEISKLGWIRPNDTDKCTTNCLLNSLGIYASIRQLGYHPYAGELSFLVREGQISREEALEAEYMDENLPAMTESLKRLSLSRFDIPSFNGNN